MGILETIFGGIFYIVAIIVWIWLIYWLYKSIKEDYVWILLLIIFWLWFLVYLQMYY